MQSRRAFLEYYAPLWASRAGERRRSGAAPDLVIADILERTVAGMRVELARLPADPTPIAPVGADDAVTWRSPVFHAAGHFDPFAGSRRDRMLASAEVCDRVGAPDFARRYRALAEAADAPADAPAALTPGACPVPAHPKRSSRTGSWSGPAAPPPAPAPFAAGPQLGLFA